MKSNKGQNVVEYILLAVAVILVFLVLLNPKTSPIKDSTNAILYSSINQIQNLTSEIRP